MEVKTSQVECPRTGTYIGVTGDTKSFGGIFNKLRHKEAVLAQDRRVYGDEIDLAKDRILTSPLDHKCNMAWKKGRIDFLDYRKKKISSFNTKVITTKLNPGCINVYDWQGSLL